MPVDPNILWALSPDHLVAAYRRGIFPMVQNGELMWFSPNPRGLMPLDDRFHVPRRLLQTIRGGRLVCSIDRCFDEVMRLCARRPGGEATWISPEMRLAYGRLREMGLAHSVEVWSADAVGSGSPAGGLYGVALGGAFFAESMFHRVRDAGKVALVHLIDQLRRQGFVLCDVQWTTELLRRFGAYDVSRREYLARLAEAMKLKRSFAP